MSRTAEWCIIATEVNLVRPSHLLIYLVSVAFILLIVVMGTTFTASL